MFPGRHCFIPSTTAAPCAQPALCHGAGFCWRLRSLSSLRGITGFLSTPGEIAQGQRLRRADFDFVGPTELGQMDGKEEEVVLISAASWWCGDLIQRPSLVWISISPSAKLKRLEEFISEISPSSVKSYPKSRSRRTDIERRKNGTEERAARWRGPARLLRPWARACLSASVSFFLKK